MKKKTDNPVVTKSVLESTLNQRFSEFEVKMDDKFEKFGREVDEKARGYRDDVLNKLDELMGELEDHRIERIALKNYVENLDKRVTKLEQPAKAM